MLCFQEPSPGMIYSPLCHDRKCLQADDKKSTSRRYTLLLIELDYFPWNYRRTRGIRLTGLSPFARNFHRTYAEYFYFYFIPTWRVILTTIAVFLFTRWFRGYTILRIKPGIPFFRTEVERIQVTAPQIPRLHKLHLGVRNVTYVLMYLLQPLAAPLPFPSSVATVVSPPYIIVLVAVVLVREFAPAPAAVIVVVLIHPVPSCCCCWWQTLDSRTLASWRWAGGVVHAWVGQKHLNCYILKCFFYRSSLANFHVSAWCKSSIILLNFLV